MALGHLTETETEIVDPQTGEISKARMLHGEIRTPSFRLKIKLHPLDKPTRDHPDFDVEGVLDGNDFDAGAAWQYRVEIGPTAGSNMFQIRFDDWAELKGLAGQQVAAFADGPGRYKLRRDRPRQQGAA
ncbi:MAG: DUF736 family protein [Thalassobaculaceae bacterium]